MVDVTLDIPDLPEPGTGRLISIPEQQISMLNEPFIRQGRYTSHGQNLRFSSPNNNLAKSQNKE